MSKLSNMSKTSQSNSFWSKVKMSLLTITLICVLTVSFIVLFLFMPVASFTQAIFDTATGGISVEVSQLSGLQALLGNNPAVGSAMSFNFVVLLILLLAVAVIPLNIVNNRIVRLVGASIAVVALTLLFFLPKMLFSKDGTIFFHPTNGLMFLIIVLTLTTALSINNMFITYKVKRDVTVSEKLIAVRSAYAEQSVETNTERKTASTNNTKSNKTVEDKSVKVTNTAKTSVPASKTVDVTGDATSKIATAQNKATTTNKKRQSNDKK